MFGSIVVGTDKGDAERTGRLMGGKRAEYETILVPRKQQLASERVRLPFAGADTG
jgi:hypothetical protein